MNISLVAIVIICPLSNFISYEFSVFARQEIDDKSASIRKWVNFYFKTQNPKISFSLIYLDCLSAVDLTCFNSLFSPSPRFCCRLSWERAKDKGLRIHI